MAENDRDALSLLAHELRTPISTIVAASTGLERGAEELSAEKRAALARLIAAEARRLARLVDDVVSVAKLDSGELPVKLERADVGALVTDAVEAAKASAPAERSIIASVTGEIEAMIDADRLRQVLDNLIDNALKHAAGTVRVSARSENATVRVEVADDGEGIPPAHRTAVFEKFHRLDSSASGTGLGLWLCRELITRMGGEVSVTDAPSGGARFAIELPALSL